MHNLYSNDSLSDYNVEKTQSIQSCETNVKFIGDQHFYSNLDKEGSFVVYNNLHRVTA